MPERSPILRRRDWSMPSVFRPENLLREARRQKGLAVEPVPEICILDPDGDLVRQLRADGRALPCPAWPCYHTELYAFADAGERFGIIGCAVGAPFAVLVAEELFAAGCQLLISVTSSGRIAEDGPAAAHFVLIDRALRDEGTSYHYRAPEGAFSLADTRLVDGAMPYLRDLGVTVVKGATWTTDAPFRETEEAIAWARGHGVLAVEMEAAALYAFAATSGKPVLCFAHVTNRMAQIEGDFEKGEANGAADALAVIRAAARAWRAGTAAR